MADQRLAQASKGVWIGIIGDVALAVMKFIVGMISNSRALVADAARSASDAASSFNMLIGSKTAQYSPGRDHSYRNGRSGTIAAIIVSLILLYVGLEIVVNSVQAMIGGVEQAPQELALIAIIISLVVKEWMFQYNIRLGKQLKSQAFIERAREHRMGVYSSIVALTGIGGAMIGSYTGISALIYLDPIASITVALMLLKKGYNLIRETIYQTMEHRLDEEDTQPIFDTIGKVKGVQAINDLSARKHGHYLIVDVKISVNPKITVLEGHLIGRHVKALLKSRFSNVLAVYVQVLPYNPSYPYNTGFEHSDGDRPTLLH